MVREVDMFRLLGEFKELASHLRGAMANQRRNKTSVNGEGDLEEVGVFRLEEMAEVSREVSRPHKCGRAIQVTARV